MGGKAARKATGHLSGNTAPLVPRKKKRKENTNGSPSADFGALFSLKFLGNGTLDKDRAKSKDRRARAEREKIGKGRNQIFGLPSRQGPASESAFHRPPSPLLDQAKMKKSTASKEQQPA